MKEQKKKSKLSIPLDAIAVSLLSLLVGIAWRLLPQTVIRADGFVHMLEHTQKQFWNNSYWYTGIDVGPNMLGAVLPKLFGINISWYLWFEVLVILVIVVAFYFLVKVLTGSRLIAFTSALITGVNYFGMWNLFGATCYCFYMERGINMPFMIISFLLMHLYLSKNKIGYLLSSALLYLVGIGLGHVELILTPAFVLYPFWWFIFQSEKRQIWKGILISLVYFFISLGITWAQQINYSGWGTPGWTFTEFVLNPWKYNYFRAIGLQLVYWSDYIPAWGYYSSPMLNGRFDVQQAAANIPNVLIVYLIVFIVLVNRLAKFRALLFTIFTSVPAILFLNSYVKLPEIVVPDSNRYLFFPTLFLSIFWSIFIWYIFLRHKDKRMLLGIILIYYYYQTNTTMINTMFHRTFGWNRSTKVVYDYVIKNRDKLPSSTLVVVSHPEFWVQEGTFFTQQIGRNEVRYMTQLTNADDWRTQAPYFKHVIKVNYDEKCNCAIETKIK